jgi:hypothetical protein
MTDELEQGIYVRGTAQKRLVILRLISLFVKTKKSVTIITDTLPKKAAPWRIRTETVLHAKEKKTELTGRVYPMSHPNKSKPHAAA